MMRLSATLVLCAAWAVAQTAPTLNLQASDGKAVALGTAGKVTAVVFYSTQCPISNEYNDRMAALYRDYSARGVQFVFVNSNQNESGAETARHAQGVGFPFSVYKDESNRVADAFEAEVTPQAFVLGRDSTVMYRGAIDDSRNAARVTKNPLREALDAALAGKPAPVAESKAFGCTIKRVQR